MTIATMHVSTPFGTPLGPTEKETAVCGQRGRLWMDKDWKAADADPRSFRRCARCEKRLGPGGLERLLAARAELEALRARTQAKQAPEADHIVCLRMGFEAILARRHLLTEDDTRTITSAFTRVNRRIANR